VCVRSRPESGQPARGMAGRKPRPHPRLLSAIPSTWRSLITPVQGGPGPATPKVRRWWQAARARGGAPLGRCDNPEGGRWDGRQNRPLPTQPRCQARGPSRRPAPPARSRRRHPPTRTAGGTHRPEPPEANRHPRTTRIRRPPTASTRPLREEETPRRPPVSSLSRTKVPLVQRQGGPRFQRYQHPPTIPLRRPSGRSARQNHERPPGPSPYPARKSHWCSPGGPPVSILPKATDKTGPRASAH
jgi:hypothetical protein